MNSPTFSFGGDAELARQFQQACKAFADACQTGRTPHVEDYVDYVPSNSRPMLLEALLYLDLEAQHERGHHPDKASYLARFPEAQGIVERVFAQAVIQRAADRASTSQSHWSQYLTTMDRGQPTPAITENEPSPSQFGRHVVEGVLGEGAFGTVYLARDQVLDRRVAIKVPRRRRITTRQDTAMYLDEARVVAQLKHESIVPVFEVGETEDGLCYVVSEFIEGRNLKDQLACERLPYHQSAQLIASIADALHLAHSKGVVHRDVKPANILLDHEGKAYLTDFGIALVEEDFGRGAVVAGTPLYMSPEQANRESHHVDGRSDIYSLGAVFYEMLTGHHTFSASGSDLLRHIAESAVKPPRQRDHRIPKELERICLRALERRISDRYTTALDMAQDLREFLRSQEPPALLPDAIGAGPRTRTRPGTPPSFDAHSSTVAQPTRVVPRGLRAFTGEDADFFLDLLPGPRRQRDGLPESIRFWKSRIEATDPVEAFSVGVIYGPSGCGKSSLLRAGILPRLSEQVHVVLVDASADRTETDLQSLIRAKVPGHVADESSLTALLHGVRHTEILGRGHKLLVVVDQFEQWLHAHPDPESTTLVTALRQCDGIHLQTLLLVRDDFQTPLHRLMSVLDIRISEQHNFQLVDRLSTDQAIAILTTLGRAHERLPSDELTKEQQAFVQDVVAQLAQGERVVCIQLALFAEMMKHKTWNREELARSGGVTAVGERFLQATFGDRTSNPEYRAHEAGVRRVLKALLPEPGAEIRGRSRSYQGLLALSNYPSDGIAFRKLIDLLDGELRLISPTIAIESPDADNSAQIPSHQNHGHQNHSVHDSSDPAACHYQLTHDYLVPAIRDWLSRKQAATRKGRAELCLEHRAAQWQRSPEARFLPSWTEYLAIVRFVPNSERSAAQASMIAAASRWYGKRLAGIAMTSLLALAAIGWVVGESQSQRIVEQMLVAEPPRLATILADKSPWYSGRLESKLQAIAVDDIRPTQERLRASLGLLRNGGPHVDWIVEQLETTPLDFVPLVRDGLRAHREEATPRLWSAYRGAATSANRLPSALLLANLDPQSAAWKEADDRFLVQSLLAATPDEYLLLRSLLRPMAHRLAVELGNACRDSRLPESSREVAAASLADYAHAVSIATFTDLLYDASPRQFDLLFSAVEKQIIDRRELTDALQHRWPSTLSSDATAGERIDAGRRRANAVFANLRLNVSPPWHPLESDAGDPEPLTQFVHRQRHFHVTPERMWECLELATDQRHESLRYAILIACGEFDRSEFTPAVWNDWQARVTDWYRNDPSPAIHGACGWLLRRWELAAIVQEVDATSADSERTTDRRWFTQPIVVSRPSKKGTDTRTDYLTFHILPAASFAMGSGEGEPGRDDDERQHEAVIPRQIAVLDREVTFLQWQMFQLSTGFRDGYEGNRRPATSTPLTEPATFVDWFGAVRFCRWLTEQAGMGEDEQCYPASAPRDTSESPISTSPTPSTDVPFYPDRKGYRLLTEAEWEYACRAGTTTAYSFGSDRAHLGHYARFDDDRPSAPIATATLRPNRFGLFDMHGNVFEWCQDWYQEDYGLSDKVHSPPERVIRGGSYQQRFAFHRSAARGARPPHHPLQSLGFRVARTMSD